MLGRGNCYNNINLAKEGGRALNYYERIQKAIDYIEASLEEEMKIEDIAKEAFMSVSNFYRMFFAITGYQAKEYIRCRRISCAAHDLKQGKEKIIEVAVKYAYNSVDAFSRSFKSITGFLPSKYTDSIKNYVFERVDVMDKYFEVQDSEVAEQYPDIKVLKEMKAMRVAYYCYYGKNPEDGAFSVMQDWVKKNNIDINNGNYRIFGYNAPDTDASGEEYGYEVCITIPEDLVVEDEKVKTKELSGGLYAVTAIKRGECLGEAIIKGWQRFQKWLEGSKYVYGEAQWLEEHLGFTQDMEHIGGVDLYMPILLRSDLKAEETEELLSPLTCVSYTVKGKNAENKARKYLFDWAKNNGIEFQKAETRLFAFYNFEKIGTPEYFYTLYLTIPEALEIKDEKLIKEIFTGGLYLKRFIKYKMNSQSWFNFIKSIEHNEKYCFGSHHFMEEYVINEPMIDGDTDIVQYMPVMRRI